MVRLRVTLAVLAALAFCLPARAVALSPVDGGTVVLGFGALYPAPAGESRTHSGVDIAAAAGERVRAPVAGTVTFAGSIPGDDGGTVRAVTIRLADGRRITLLPLLDTTVRAGEAIAAGGPVGTLASDGDGSWAQPHVHCSVRRGELYVDPSDLLAVPPAPSPAPKPAAAQEPVVAAGSPQPRPIGAPAVCIGEIAPEAVSAPQVQPAQPVIVQAPAVSAVRPAVAPRTVSAPAAARAPSFATGRGTRPRSVWGIVGAVVACGVATFFVLTRRAVTRAAVGEARMSDRWETLLRQLRAGATLCGLFSCSGQLPSQSRGRPVQRR